MNIMWSVNADEEHMSRSRNINRSSSSSSSSFTGYQNHPRTTTRTMEEVWKDINLSSSPLHHHSSTALRGIMFQDFLAGPFENATAAPPVPPPPQHPATMLTLNSVTEFNLNGSLSPSSRQSPAMLFPPHGGDAVVMSQSQNQNSNKRCATFTPEFADGGGSGDRRHKRMIKNRESAARSRAYTTELELEVDQLTKENAKLREQQKQLCQAAAAADRRSKHGLHRTSTAPF